MFENTNIKANNKFTIVGLILMNVSSCKNKVKEPKNSKSNYWLNSIVLANTDERDEFLTFTNSRNVMTRAMWTPMHTLPMYRRCYRADLTNAEAIEKRLVNIPSSVV